jgi:hypothetical protein
MYAVGFTATCVPGGADQDTDRGFWVRPMVLGVSATTDDIKSLLLGGGFGFLTGQHGLVIDNLLQVRLRPSLPPGRVMGS